MNSAEEKLLQIQTAIVELLIQNADSIGVVSESLQQRSALMTEFFGTEDELEASDDNTLEDSKDCREQRKKHRKRSNSLQGQCAVKIVLCSFLAVLIRYEILLSNYGIYIILGVSGVILEI